MQGIVVLDLLIRVEMEPALAALIFRPAVPGDGECLHPAVRELDEILLQRIDTKCVFHFEGGELAVRPVGLDEEPAVPAQEARMHTVIVETRIVEIAEHSLVGGVRHCELVLGAAPKPRLPRGPPAPVPPPTKVVPDASGDFPFKG